MSSAHAAELVLAAGCFAAGLACSAGGWRALLPRGVTLVDACARFGCGSLANTFLPARGGDVVRMSLFGRIVPGGMFAVAGAVAAFEVARWLAIVPLGIGAAGSTLPPVALAAPAAALAPIGIAAVLAARGSRRAATVMASLRRAPPAAYLLVLLWAAATLAAKVAGATLVAGAIGVPHAFSAALLVVPALELAGTVPLTPANIGVAEGAAALAFHAHGLSMERGLAAGFALHAVETAAGLAFGGAGAGLLLRRSPVLHRIVTVRPTTVWKRLLTLSTSMRRKIEPLLCELHAHTRWSDGALTVPELVDLYGRNGFDVLCVTDHVNRSDDPWLPADAPARGIVRANHADYLAELGAQAERAMREYDLLLLPGLELTYNDLDPYLAAHAVAIGCRAYVSVDDGIDVALANARGEGAALVAAHPYRARRGGPFPSRLTLRWSRDWRRLRDAVDRWELFNRHDLYGWTAERGLPSVANGDFHRPEHLHGWKTLLPVAKNEAAVVGYLRSSRPTFLTRIDPPLELPEAA
ncbi:MAG: flippase-like domain-containing protein [Actinobacteria bacterium]|nr:flippase-like domain-containing protein [Actinomycetota bacterium]